MSYMFLESCKLTTDHAILTEHTSEIAKLQREIRDMELELARIKTAHPPEDVRTTLGFN